MKRLLAWTVALSVWLLMGVAPAQEPEFDEEPARPAIEVTQPKIDLASARVRPEAPVFVNALLAFPPSAEIYSIRQTIQFPAALQFKQARLGIAANLAVADLAVTMKDASGNKVDKRDLARSVELAIAAKQPLAEGPLLEIEFKLMENQDQVIVLPHTASAVDRAGKPIADLAFAAGEVVVSQAAAEAPRPAIGCFFFTH